MVGRVALALSIGLLTFPALAAAEKSVHCIPLAKAKASAEGVTIATATLGQFHFLQGFYAANPDTPPGLPPGDGALIFVKGKDGMIVWTRGGLACAPLMIPGGMDKLVKLLDGVKTGALDRDGNEL